MKSGIYMNTKQKLKMSNLVNFCFFILGFLFLLIKLLTANITVLNTNLKSDLLYIMVLLVIILLISFVLYLIPGLIITSSVLFISFRPNIFTNKVFKVLNTYKKSNQHILKEISVCRC